MNMVFKRKLPIPKEIKEMYPISPEGAAAKRNNDESIRAVLSGESNKLLVVIGPCSADREDAVIEYISRLRPLQERVADKILIVPRIYTNKPRTTGAGYKGMLHQPNPQAQSDMLRGLISIRKLHMRAINETGFSCADEMLYPEHHRFLDDVLSYVAVGARSVEDQQHRMTASGLDVPVGMKNPTGGDLSVMMNALKAAQSGHTFIYRNWEVETAGNPLAHAILRGYMNKHGQSLPNYHYEDLAHLAALYAEGQFENPAAIIDTNHANSGKNPFEQPRIISEVLHACRHNAEIGRMVKGFMVESYIEDGNQKIGEGIYGKSITDACLGWAKTERLIYNIAESL
jgi:3-deoxy-7-phosphoheptulonate synthase